MVCRAGPYARVTGALLWLCSTNPTHRTPPHRHPTPLPRSFEEQKLRARESIDMPVFFYVDKEFAVDPRMADVRELVLSYTFYKASPCTCVRARANAAPSAI